MKKNKKSQSIQSQDGAGFNKSNARFPICVSDSPASSPPAQNVKNSESPINNGKSCRDGSNSKCSQHGLSGYGEGTLHIPSNKEETQNGEPEQANNHSGTAREPKTNTNGGGGGDGGEMVKVTKLIDQFDIIKAQELKRVTRYNYLCIFRRFANHINLEKKSKRDLRDRGRKYILDYLRTKVPKKSWKKIRAALQTFWEDVLELEWPLRRSDIKLKVKAGRGYTPSDNVILKWAEAMKHEPDPYLRLMWVMIIQHGWRPSHIGGIRWKHIQRDKDNNPIAIVAHPENGEFKTDQPVAVHLVPDVREPLVEWEKECIRQKEEIRPEDFILPWRARARRKKVQWDRPFSTSQSWRLWSDLQTRYKLPKLTPRDCRHWVSTACRKAGLSKAATAYLQGHDSSGGSTMRDWYDHISEHDAIEEQSQILPNGPIGTLLQPEIKMEGDIPIEAKNLYSRFFNDEIGELDLAKKLGELKRKMNEAEVLKP